MVQGQGIVDLVNTYVQVALRSGLVGLSLFAGVLVSAFLAAIQARKLSHRAKQGLAVPQILVGPSRQPSFAVIVTIGSVNGIG